MAAVPAVTLYDLASKGRNSCWSLNPWKTRILLNYKEILYETKWLEYTELADYFTSRSVPINPEAGSHTIPTILLTKEDRYIVDSRIIASELESRYPSPSLHLDAPELPEIETALTEAMAPIRNIVLPRVPRVILNPVSADYFQTTRAKRFGMSLDELERTKGGEVAYEAAKEPWSRLAEIVKRKGGPFVLGEQVSYADFVIVGAIEFARRTGEDVFERIVAFDECFGRLYEACKPWLERDDR